jgi:hypothetical protein
MLKDRGFKSKKEAFFGQRKQQTTERKVGCIYGQVGVQGAGWDTRMLSSVTVLSGVQCAKLWEYSVWYNARGLNSQLSKRMAGR